MSSLLNTHTPTQIDCIFGLGEGSEVVSLHKQLSDQFFPISSAVAASGTVFYFYFIFFCLLRPAASSLVRHSSVARAASGMARDHLCRGQLGSPSRMRACGLSARRARVASRAAPLFSLSYLPLASPAMVTCITLPECIDLATTGTWRGLL